MRQLAQHNQYTIWCQYAILGLMSQSTPPKVPQIQFPPLMRIVQIAWRNYQARFDVILLVNLLIALPLYFFVDWSTPRELFATANSTEPATVLEFIQRINELGAFFVQPAFLAHFGIQLLAQVFSVFIVVVIALMMKHHFERKKKTNAELFRAAMQYYPAAIVTTILSSAMILLGYMAFILPGLLLEIVLVLAVPLVVWHGLSPWQAIVRSVRLGLRYWWFVLGSIIIVELVVSALSALIVVLLPDAFGFTTVALTLVSIFDSFTVVFAVLIMSALTIVKKTAKKKDDAGTSSQKSTSSESQE